jgi:hypothetical protein
VSQTSVLGREDWDRDGLVELLFPDQCTAYAESSNLARRQETRVGAVQAFVRYLRSSHSSPVLSAAPPPPAICNR